MTPGEKAWRRSTGAVTIESGGSGEDDRRITQRLKRKTKFWDEALV